jgi:hypothetical protein
MIDFQNMEQYNMKYVAPNRYPSECQITIYRQSGIVIATDIDKGMSVTNACAEIANEIVRQYDVNPHRMIFIEQYRPGRPDQTTDLVKFDFGDGKHGPMGRFRNPDWTHIPPDDFKKMIQIAEETEVM